MSGTPRPDPAFLHNVPTSVSSSLTSSTSSTSSTLTSLISTSTTSTPTPSTSPIATTSPHSIYPYSPSTILAIAFSILFALLIPYHFYHVIHKPYVTKSVTQKHKYTIPLLIACTLCTLGYALRIVSSSSDAARASVTLYAASQIGIIVAPIFVCATLYLQVTHLIRLCLPDGSGRSFLGISPRWLGRVFIGSDVLSFLCQGVGSAIAASGNWTGHKKDTGTKVMLLGLVGQLVTFTVYLAVFTLFCLKVWSGKAEEKRAQVQVVGVSEDSSSGEVEEHYGRDFGFNPLVKQVVKGMWVASVLVEVSLSADCSKVFANRSCRSGRHVGQSTSRWV